MICFVTTNVHGLLRDVLISRYGVINVTYHTDRWTVVASNRPLFWHPLRIPVRKVRGYGIAGSI